MRLTPSPIQHFHNNDGTLLVDGKLYTYAAGGTTPLSTYTDSTGGTEHDNPIILDARGEAAIWLTSSKYKFALHNADDAEIWVIDQIGDDTYTSWLTNIGGTDTITATATGLADYVTGQKFSFIAANANTGPATLNINSIGAKSLTKNGSTALVDGDITTGKVIGVTYDGTRFQLDSGSSNVYIQRGDIPSAPSLVLNKWAERGEVNVRQNALPANFDFDTDDAAPYINALIADVEDLGDGYKIVFDGTDTWLIGSQISFNSDHSTGIMVRDIPRLVWSGSTMNTSTQDNSSGAMILFTGTDHAFGGIDGTGILFIDCASKANFAVYWAGSWNAGFRMRNIHAKHAQLDLFRHINSGTSGPVAAMIENCTMFPASDAVYSAMNAVCGRYPINIALNSSTGQLTVRNCGMDSGASGIIGITGSTYAGTDILLEDLRFEMYKPSGDCVVLDYGAAGSAGTLTVRNCKNAAAAGGTSTGTLRSMIRNATSSGVKPIIRVEPFLTNDTMTDIYTHVADTSKSVVSDVKRLGSDLIINAVSNVGGLPRSTALGASPVSGEFCYNGAGEQIILRSDAGTRYMRAGFSGVSGPGSTPYTMLVSDSDNVVHNNNVGTMTINLPSIATVGSGWRTPLMATVTAAVMTIQPNGTDKVDTKGAGVTYVSSNAAGNTLQLIAGPASTWLVWSQKGTWS